MQASNFAPPLSELTALSAALVQAQTLPEVLAHQASQAPSAPALHFEGKAISYAGLARRSTLCAQWLHHEHGVRPGDRVAWLGFNHPDQIVLLFALAQLGAVLVPLNFRLAPAEWQAVLRDCTPSLLLHDQAWQAQAQELGLPTGRVPSFDGDTALPGQHWATAPDAARPHAATPYAAKPEAAALLVYTSGTTGLPKGAVHTQANLLANIRAACASQDISAADCVLSVLPLFHVGGLCIQTLPALAAGATVVLHQRFDAGAALQAIAQHRPTLTVQVPATLAALLAHPLWAQTDLRCLRGIAAGSSVLPRHLIEAFHARDVPVCNVYGATETGPVSIVLWAAHARSHAGSCGWPAPAVEVGLHQVKDGVGELLLRAPNIVNHYWPNTPALDADGWFHSGDLGQQAADGSFTIVGRAKDMIISGGENIYPAEIENLLCTHPALAECAVLGLPEPRWGEEVVAAVVLRPGYELEPERLSEFLAQHLARYKLPKRYLSLPELPKTALGKVQKPLLRERFLG